MKDRDAETVTGAINLTENDVAQQLKDEHLRFNNDSKVLALQVIQSWPKQESNLFEKEKYNEMGLDLARKLCPGHSAWVVTHFDRGHAHNHIVISMIHSETGKRINQNRSWIEKVRDANDAVCKENGLSTLTPSLRSQEAKLPQKARDMVARGRRSYLYDVMQKADFARSVSSSFDEYVGFLKVLGVDARVENKNISYFYGDKTKGIRGKRLGEKYNKAGLVGAFKENDEKFAQHPGLRERIVGEFGAIHDGKGRLVGTPSHLLLESAGHTRFREKDYYAFRKIGRDRTRDELPSGFVGDRAYLLKEFERAKNQSLFEYCKHNKIGLKENKDGHLVLKGREHIVVEANGFKNTRNHTNGSLIDFVSIHHDLSLLQAVARINRNPRILLIEQVAGETKRGFSSFRMPTERMEQSKAVPLLRSFLKQNSLNPNYAEKYIESKKLHVTPDSKVWLFSGKGGDGAIEFEQNMKGEWSHKKHGPSGSGFESRVGRSKRVVVFSDPLSYLESQSKHSHGLSQSDSLFVMMSHEDHSGLAEFLALHAHISEVQIVEPFSQTRQPNDKMVSQHLKKIFDPFSIKVGAISIDRHRGHEIGFDL